MGLSKRAFGVQQSPTDSDTCIGSVGTCGHFDPLGLRRKGVTPWKPPHIGVYSDVRSIPRSAAGARLERARVWPRVVHDAALLSTSPCAADHRWCPFASGFRSAQRYPQESVPGYHVLWAGARPGRALTTRRERPQSLIPAPIDFAKREGGDRRCLRLPPPNYASHTN